MSKQIKISMRAMLLAILSVCMLATGCAEEESTGQARVALEMGSYVTAQQKIMNMIFPKAYASVSDLRMCFKRLRFKLADEDSLDPATDEDNIDFELGEVAVSSAGASLGSVNIAAGRYRRVEFDLEDDCVGGYSLLLTNDNGTYSTSDRITIKFEGDFVIEEDTTLNLDAQVIVDALNAYSGAGQLKDAAEAIEGSF